MKRTRYIYKTTCLPTGRYYVGMHSTLRPSVQYFGSGIQVQRSLKKHGREQHCVEILEYCDTDEQLRQRERDLITPEMLADPLCMNMMSGGEGGFSEHIRAQSHTAFRTKLANDDEFRQHISAINAERAKKVTPEGRKNCSEALRERYKDPAFKAKQAAGAKDRYALMKAAEAAKISAGWKLLKDPANNKRRKLFPPEQIQQMLDANWTVWEVK